MFKNRSVRFLVFFGSLCDFLFFLVCTLLWASSEPLSVVCFGALLLIWFFIFFWSEIVEPFHLLYIPLLWHCFLFFGKSSNSFIVSAVSLSLFATSLVWIFWVWSAFLTDGFFSVDRSSTYQQFHCHDPKLSSLTDTVWVWSEFLTGGFISFDGSSIW